MKIHHAVAKKAAKHGIALKHMPDGVTVSATHPDLADSVAGDDPTKVLFEALKALGYIKPKRVRQPGAPKVRAAGKKAKAKKAAVKANKSMVLKDYKEHYKKHGSGQGNGDRLDQAMRDALDGDDTALPKIARENNVPFLWQVLNRGSQSMNLRNVLRARIKRGEKVSVLGKSIASL